jgi:hypothetical protein
MLVNEALNGGVVTARHPTLLRPSEVQAADEMILKPGDPALQRAPGRTAYGTVRSTGISCTTNGTTALSSSAAFGTDIASVVVTSGSPYITKSSAFGSIVEGQTVVGTGIPAGTVVRRVIDSSTVELNKNATAGGTVTVTFSDLHPGTFIAGTGITVGTFIASITSASALTMSVTATNSSTTSRTFSEAVSGVEALEFSSVEDYLLVAKAADKLYTSPLSGITGTFTALLVGLSQNADAILQAIRFNNRHIFLTGYDTPRVLYYKNNAVVSRTLGMLPVKDFPGAVAVSGSWSSFADFREGYYYFVVTEVFNAGEDDEVESTYDGDPKYARITDYTTQGIKITFTNTGGGTTDRYNNGLYGQNAATHRRIYMAPRQADPLPVPDLSTFRRVGGDVVISATEVTLNDTSPFQKGYASVANTYGSFVTLFPGGAANALSQVTKQSVTATFSTTVGSENVLTSSAAFGTVTVGMVITSTGNKVPYGTTVLSVTSSSSLIMSAKATSSGSETVGFGNKPTFDNQFASDPSDTGANRALAFQSFGINNIGGFSSGSITGVRVRVFGRFQADSGDDRGFYIGLTKGAQGGSPTSAERWAKFPTIISSAGLHIGAGTLDLGGQFDTWGVTWSPSDFVDGTTTFGVTIRKHASAVNFSHLIDGVEVTIYAGANSINLDGEAFKTIVLSDQIGNSFGVGAAGAPPAKSTTGDIINGQFVCDDGVTGTDLVASLPDDMDAVPNAYRLPLDDRIKLVKAYGRGGIIGCENSMKRLNYFPKETDADFTRGQATEDITSDHGIVGPRAAVLVDLPGRGTVLAYHSHNGLHGTDAVTSVTLNEDIDWVGSVSGTPLIEPTLIHRTVLKNYPKLYLLALYYVPYGGTRMTKVMYFSYHPMHLKEQGKLPAIGPVTCQSAAADSFLLLGQSRLVTGHGLDGKVYVEDNGTVDENSVAVAPTIRTRRFYASGPGREGRIERLYLVADAAGDATTGAFSAAIYYQNQRTALTLAHTPTGDTVFGGLIELMPDDTLETFEVAFSKSTSQTAAFRMQYIFFNDERSFMDLNG